MPLGFAMSMGVALGLGLTIGIERQLRQHEAGMRTNALVCLGAALFVSVAQLVADDSPTRIAAQVVSGIGFLCGGVILHEGLTVKGLATAATLWCTAAVGVLAGMGFVAEATVATGAILVANVVFRPLSNWLDRHTLPGSDVDFAYRLRIICDHAGDTVIRAIVLQDVSQHPGMSIHSMLTRSAGQPGQTEIVAEIHAHAPNDHALHELISRVNLEPSVTSASCERIKS